MKKRLSAILLAISVMLNLSACSSGMVKNEYEMMTDSAYIESGSFGSIKNTMTPGTTGTYTANDGSYDYEISVEEVYVEEEGKPIDNDLSERKIIKTAHLRFQTEEYDSFIQEMTSCIELCGGYIESSEAYDGGLYSSRYSRNSSHVVRIPQKSYSSFMNEVCGLGNMTYKSENSEDVTMSYVDTESRITAYEAEYNALIEILNKADSLSDVIQLQSRISEVTYMLENYKSQLRKYNSLIAYCTVNINIEEVWRETKSEDVMTFGEKISLGLEDTLIDIIEDFTDFTVEFITSLPYILIWAVVIFIAVVIIKVCTKKAKAKREAKKANEKSENKENS